MIKNSVNIVFVKVLGLFLFWQYWGLILEHPSLTLSVNISSLKFLVLEIIRFMF